MPRGKGELIIRSRVNLRTEVQKKIFIQALTQLLNVQVACKVTGLGRTLVYQWKKEDPQFEQDWLEAIALAEGSLESATYLKLAQSLQDKRLRISIAEARLIEMFLGGFFPDKYRQNKIEINNNAQITIDWSKVPDQVLNAFFEGNLTLNDVYQATLQSGQPERPTTSAE